MNSAAPPNSAVQPTRAAAFLLSKLLYHRVAARAAEPRTLGDELMANRRLTESELASLANPLVQTVRAKLQELSGDDTSLLWALRRKLAKELLYDERGKPMHRKLLKATKRGEQQNKCAVCQGELPSKNAVLDRYEAMKGYTAENTRLICPECDVKIQTERGYA